MTEPLRPALSRLWSSEPDGGMSLQLSASIEGREHEVLTVLADPRDEVLWVAVQAGSTRVQIPLAVLRKALDVAAEDVHSAEWFARQDAAASDV
ncbi:hypothetical protein NY99_08040 [Xanthomonas phaseoli pv. phaseoli]|uniref:Uncharacterized protein n=1 Tax=Xanthomonas campestris pv. glycines TaxID=473421 RepID=A0AAX0HYC9_XANCG|nr:MULTISPECIES: hypothetical protein [Xanthomonas]AOY61921.1 hypothetical protein BHE84_06950 [Xanthomonas citri pv. glycines str. 8ra]ARV24414.1 hypothetical protein A9D66_17885 [Xanthomonas citri pv. glycines str. 12-2]EWC50326.1 hypothetical protein XAR_2755 [Xanthomonas citri pv. glycines str. 8ra]KGU56497.1 hypothetical protein NY99_08040 [Xanthomonas phaseoli pv. phaseoli]KHF46963.1 hypothetical protein QQ30_18810 [Xanthomonas phaseoli pv. phaseoli]